MQLSASATARPPSLQSWALLISAALNEAAQGRVQAALLFQIATRRRAGFQAVQALQPGRAAQAAASGPPIHRFAQQNDRVALVLEPLGGDVLRLFNQADQGHGRRRINGAGGALVVEAAIAAGHGDVEGAAGLGQAAHAIPSIARTTPGCAGCQNSNCPSRPAAPRRRRPGFAPPPPPRSSPPS